MNLEQIVASRELCKEWPYETGLYWIRFRLSHWIVEARDRIGEMASEDVERYGKPSPCHNAPTFPEVWNELPKEISINGKELYLIVYKYNDKTICEYKGKYQYVENTGGFIAKKPVDAAIKLHTWCVEKGYVK